MRAGTSGTPASKARWKAPFLNDCSRPTERAFTRARTYACRYQELASIVVVILEPAIPSLDRVPSGKIATQTLFSRMDLAAALMEATAFSWFDREIGM